MSETIRLEGAPFQLSARLAVVPVAAWRRGAGGGETVEPLELLVSSPAGIQVLSLPGAPDPGALDGGAGEALGEAERERRTRGLLCLEGDGCLVCRLHWPDAEAGPTATPVARLRFAGDRGRLSKP